MAAPHDSGRTRVLPGFFPEAKAAAEGMRVGAEAGAFRQMFQLFRIAAAEYHVICLEGRSERGEIVLRRSSGDSRRWTLSWESYADQSGGG